MLGEREMVSIKGAKEPVPAHRLLGVAEPDRKWTRAASTLIGRQRELAFLEQLLDISMGGRGVVVTVVGAAGIGKSRLVQHVSEIAERAGLDVFTTSSESHTREIPFRAVARLFRAGLRVDQRDAEAARIRLRERFADADTDDLVLLEDLLGIRDAGVTLPDIAPDAQRRRLTALINRDVLARAKPAVWAVEDAHWVDEVSESMLADFFAAISQTPSLVLITFRPEYRGRLARLADAQHVALQPLSDIDTYSLATELIGEDPSVKGVAATITDRASGNPFFVEELVRDLIEREVLHGRPRAYQCRHPGADISVPPTLQATIGARIDRLTDTAKRTLTSAAVIGMRFGVDLLSALTVDVDITPLIAAELIDQIPTTKQPVYVFRHPLIRTVAYESQLTSDRARLHRRLAAAIEERASTDGDAALIAEHLESAGDLLAAFGWHMRAGAWLNYRNIAAARGSWRRAKAAADRLPDECTDRLAMRIAPRTLLCGTGYRVGGSGADAVFAELADLCKIAGDQRSLAIGTAGLALARTFAARRREASQLADELGRILESIGDPSLSLALSLSAMLAKHETAEVGEMLRWAEHAIELAAGDATAGNLILRSPLALALVMKAVAQWSLGLPGWRSGLDHGMKMAYEQHPTQLAGMMWRKYLTAVPYGVLLADETALVDSANTLTIAEQSGDDLALNMARTIRGVVLVHRGGRDRDVGLGFLVEMRERILRHQFVLIALPVIELHLAREALRSDDIDGAVASTHKICDDLFAAGGTLWDAFATSVLVDALLKRATPRSIVEVTAAVDRLITVSSSRNFTADEVSVLRMKAILAQAKGSESEFRKCRDRYERRAAELGFEGHVAAAAAMR